MSSPLHSNDDLATLRQEINELRATLAAIQSHGHGPGSSFLAAAESSHATDRRTMLKTVGALAAGVAAVGLLKPMQASANGVTKNVPAATGNALLIGTFNSPTASGDVTGLVNPGAALFPKLFQVDNYATAAFSSPANSIISIVGHVNDANATPTGQDLYGVYGQATGATGTAFGVYGVAGTLASPSGDGVTGIGSRGVVGAAGTGGCGVDGSVTGGTNGWGVSGSADVGVGGHFTGGRCALYLTPGTGAVPNPNLTAPSGSGQGDVYVGSTNGSLWYNAGGTNPYRKLAGSDTAGAVHILATPVRYVDTRNGTGGVTAPFNNGDVRSYNFVSLQPGNIPAGARGVFGNITAASPGGNGNFQINTANSFPAGAASVMNFTNGVNLSNHFVGSLDATGQLFVKGNVLTGTGQVQLLIDIQGYFI